MYQGFLHSEIMYFIHIYLVFKYFLSRNVDLEFLIEAIQGCDKAWVGVSRFVGFHSKHCCRKFRKSWSAGLISEFRLCIDGVISVLSVSVLDFRLDDSKNKFFLVEWFRRSSGGIPM